MPRSRQVKKAKFTVVFRTEKPELWGYHKAIKNFEDLFSRLDRMHERDRRTDRQTLRHTVGRAMHRVAR